MINLDELCYNDVINTQTTVIPSVYTFAKKEKKKNMMEHCWELHK